MKIFKIAIICVSMVTLFSTMAVADTGTNAAGASFTIGAGTTLAFTPSPTTLVAWNVIATSYAVTAVSARTNAANGRQYGVVSSQSPIYELAAVVTADVVVLTAPTSSSTLGSTWVDKAGNTAP